MDTQVKPLATNANAVLNQADHTLATVQGALEQGSELRYGLNQLLSEATGAARALRTLADYLERHPEALIKGKQ